MKKIEDVLKEQELARGAPDFDDRMQRLFSDAPNGPAQFIQRPVALWQAVAFSVAALAVGYWMRPAAPEAAPAQPAAAEPTESVRTVYVYTQEARDMENMFGFADESPGFLSPMNASRVTVSISDNVEQGEENDTI